MKLLQPIFNGAMAIFGLAVMFTIFQLIFTLFEPFLSQNKATFKKKYKIKGAKAPRGKYKGGQWHLMLTKDVTNEEASSMSIDEMKDNMVWIPVEGTEINHAKLQKKIDRAKNPKKKKKMQKKLNRFKEKLSWGTSIGKKKAKAKKFYLEFNDGFKATGGRGTPSQIKDAFIALVNAATGGQAGQSKSKAKYVFENDECLLIDNSSKKGDKKWRDNCSVNSNPPCFVERTRKEKACWTGGANDFKKFLAGKPSKFKQDSRNLLKPMTK